MLNQGRQAQSPSHDLVTLSRASTDRTADAGAAGAAGAPLALAVISGPSWALPASNAGIPAFLPIALRANRDDAPEGAWARTDPIFIEVSSGGSDGPRHHFRLAPDLRQAAGVNRLASFG